MRDEEQARRAALGAQAAVVQGGDDGLAGAGGGHHEVAPAAVALALGLELVEDLALERVGSSSKGESGRRAPRGCVAARSQASNALGLVVLELRARPVAVEGRAELVEDGCRSRRPRGGRSIRGRRGSAVCERFEEPMRPSRSRSRAGRATPWRGGGLRRCRRRPSPRRRARSAPPAHAAQTSPRYVEAITRTRPPAATTSARRSLDDSHAGPADERDQQVDGVGGRQLAVDLPSDSGLAAGVDQQSTRRERDRRPLAGRMDCRPDSVARAPLAVPRGRGEVVT